MIGISRLLIARGAQSNPSIFRAEGLLPIETVAIAYVEKAKALQHSFTNIKYTIMQMWPESYHLSDTGKQVLHARNTQDLLQVEQASYPSHLLHFHTFLHCSFSNGYIGTLCMHQKEPRNKAE
jgi:tRNA-dihydrouridine synthase